MPALSRPLLTLAMPELIVIPNWDRDFENAKSRTVERTSFFCVQNHFDGKKIRRLQNLKKSVEIYGAFHAICAIASRCRYRGVLLDNDGPLDALSLSEKTGFPAEPLQNAIKQLANPLVALLELHTIEFAGGEWILPDTVRTWAIPRDTRRTSLIPRDIARTRGDSEVPGKNDPVAPQVSSGGPAGTSVILRDTAGPRGSAQYHAVSRREEKRIEEKGPPAVPQGGQSKAEQRITDPEEAKRLICEKILGGKDPGRAWSYDAQARLAELTKPPGMPLHEIETIAWFRGLPANPDIPELAKRKFPITETTLMGFWGDEFQRADAYRKKNHAGANGVLQKKDWPAGGREFFRWKYGPEVRLPERFEELEADQRKEWDAEHEAFEKSQGAKRQIA